MAVEYIYDGKSEGNILVAGQTGSGKTTLFMMRQKITRLVKLKICFGWQKFSFYKLKKKR